MNLSELFLNVSLQTKICRQCLLHMPEHLQYLILSFRQTAEGWEGATQYPRICYRIDMQVNQERSSAGTLYVAMYTVKIPCTIIEDIETAVKHCLQDVLRSRQEKHPFCVAWARTRIVCD